MKKIFYSISLLFGQALFAQTDTTFFPLQIRNYWRLVSTYNNDFIEWKIVADTAFSNHKKYFVLNTGWATEYLRKSENGDVVVYSPKCDTEYVKYPFSMYRGPVPGNYLITVPYAGFSKEGCGINAYWDGVIVTAQNRFILSEAFCDWQFTKGIGLSGYYPCMDSYHLDRYNLNKNPLYISPVPTMEYKYILYQNYPNPFNPSTKIAYVISENGFVSLKVYDLLGREIKILINGFQKFGKYEAEFNAEGLSSGIYFYKLDCNNFTDSKKMYIVK